jgi:hypothetical protein
MELRIRETGEVISDLEFRRRHPNTSFPKVISRETINNFGVDPVFEGPQASTTSPYETSVRSGVEEIEGKWFTRYIVGPIFTDSVDEDGVVTTALHKQAEYEASVDASKASSVRDQRNKKLTECDWTQLTDSPLNADAKNAWALYRETLRMVPQQTGFPWDVEWPPQPTT